MSKRGEACRRCPVNGCELECATHMGCAFRWLAEQQETPPAPSPEEVEQAEVQQEQMEQQEEELQEQEEQEVRDDIVD